MLRPFVDLLAEILQLYSFCVIAWAVLATLISFKIVNPYQPIVQKTMYALNRLCNPVLDRIRKVMPDLGGIDLSPIIMLLLLRFAQNILYTYFYNL